MGTGDIHLQFQKSMPSRLKRMFPRCTPCQLLSKIYKETPKKLYLLNEDAPTGDRPKQLNPSFAEVLRPN